MLTHCKNKTLKFLAAVLLLAFPGLVQGVSLETKKDDVKVLDAAKKGAQVLEVLPKGKLLEASERTGMYWKVITSSGQPGFVSMLKVKRKPGGSSSISKAIRAASEDGRADGDDVENGRVRSAVMGVRGLDESEDTKHAGTTKPNLRLVYAMEDRKVSLRSLERLEEQIMREVEQRSQRRSPRK